MIGNAAMVWMVRDDCLPEKVSRTVFGSIASVLVRSESGSESKGCPLSLKVR